MMSSLMATLGLDVTPFQKGLAMGKADAAKAGNDFTKAFGNMATGMLPFASAAGAVASLEETIRRSIEWGDQIQSLADRTGISTDAIQLWSYALRQTGGDINTAVGFFEKLSVARQKAMSGNEDEINAFKRLGVSLDDLKSKRIEDIAKDIARVFESGDPQEMISDLRAVGGKGAGEMVASFRDGLAGVLDEGNIHIVSPDDISQLKEAADLMASLADNTKAILATLTVRLMEAGKAGIYQAQMLIAAIAGALAKPWAMVTAAKENMDAVRDAYAYDAVKAAEAREAKEGKRKPLGGALGESESNKQAKEAERVAKEIARLKEDAAKIDRDRDLSAMTAAQRVLALNKELALIKAYLATDQSEEDKAKADVVRARVESELAKANKAAEDETKKEAKKDESQKFTRYQGPEVNSLQRIGAYVSPQESLMKSVAEKSEEHLARLNEKMSQLVKDIRQTRY